MPAVVTFEPLSVPPQIVEIGTGGDNTIDVIEMYSEWKEFVGQSDNAKHPPAFRTIGGDPTNPATGEDFGRGYFLLPPWRLRLAESDHQLVLDGNFFSPGVRPDVPTLGVFNTNLTIKFSNLTTGVALMGARVADMHAFQVVSLLEELAGQVRTYNAAGGRIMVVDGTGQRTTTGVSD